MPPRAEGGTASAPITRFWITLRIGSSVVPSRSDGADRTWGRVVGGEVEGAEMIAFGTTVAGTALVVAVWLSVLRTVFVPRQRPPVVARVVPRVVAVVAAAVGRRVPGVRGERVMTLSAPLSLFAILGVWLAGLAAGFALLAVGAGVPATPAALGRFAVVHTGGAVDVLAAAGWFSAVLVTAVFLLHLVRVTDAYSRREILVAGLAAQAVLAADAERIIADHVRGGSRAGLDALFATWARWLADIRCTHVGYPVLVHYRPATELCWLEASVIMLDAAALVEALAPSWALPHSRVLLDTGVGCLQRIGAELGIEPSRAEVSLHGREQRVFADTVRLVSGAGLPVERGRQQAWEVFQGARTRYAPYAAEMASKLLYRLDACWVDGSSIWGNSART